MPQQARGGIEGAVIDQAELVRDVGEVARFQRIRHEPRRIEGVEGLGHVQAIQPHLLRIDFFVPEASFRSAGLLPDLQVERIHHLAVLLPAGQFIQAEEGAARADMVHGIGAALVVRDAPVGVDDGIIPGIHIVEDGRIAVAVKHIQEGKQLQARGIVPLERAFAPVQPGSVRAAGHLAAHHLYGQRRLGRTGGQGCEQEEKSERFHHRLSYGFQTMPSSFWYITFSKVYSASWRGFRVCAHFTRGPRAPGPVEPYSA